MTSIDDRSRRPGDWSRRRVGRGTQKRACLTFNFLYNGVLASGAAERKAGFGPTGEEELVSTLRQLSGR